MASPCFADPLVILALPACRRLTLCRVAGQYFVVWRSLRNTEIRESGEAKTLEFQKFSRFVLIISKYCRLPTPPWRIRLKARIDRADQTTRIYTQKYVKIRQNMSKWFVLITLKV